jgi:hypothetical protein
MNDNGDSSAPVAEPSATPCADNLPARHSETPRAYSAFMAFVELGRERSLQAVADKLNEELFTIKKWSSKYDWTARIQTFNSGLLAEQVQHRARLQRQSDQEWAERLDHLREQEWQVSQRLLAAARCFLESFGEDDLSRMTLAQVSRALNLSSTIARRALLGADPAEPLSNPAAPATRPEVLDSIQRVYGRPKTAGTQTPGSTSI